MDMLKDRNSAEDVARMENLEELTRAWRKAWRRETFTDFLDARLWSATPINSKASPE